MRMGMLQVEVLDHPARATRWDEAATALYCPRGKIRILESLPGERGEKDKRYKKTGGVGQRSKRTYQFNHMSMQRESIRVFSRTLNWPRKNWPLWFPFRPLSFFFP